jgi:hypothetical protein
MYEVILIKENPKNNDNSKIEPKYNHIEVKINKKMYEKIKGLLKIIKDPLGE